MSQNATIKNRIKDFIQKQIEAGNEKMTSRERTHFLIFMCMCLLFLLMNIFVIRIGYSTGPSMQPTIYEGDIILYEQLFWKTNPVINRGDIVTIHGDFTNGDTYTKRVIAIAGDTIGFDHGKVILNGQLLDESEYLNPNVITYGYKTYAIPDGYCFVMGDNRFFSADSRLWDSAFVSYSDVTGRKILRIPTSKLIKTKDGYTPNKEITVDNDLYESYVETLNAKIDSMFNTGYTEILKDQDAFVANYTSVMPDQEDMAYKLIEWYADHKAATTAHIKTGKCMLYKDMNFNILRASVDIRIVGTKDAAEAFYEMYGIDSTDGAATVICECYFFEDGSQKLINFTLQPVEE